MAGTKRDIAADRKMCEAATAVGAVFALVLPITSRNKTFNLSYSNVTDKWNCVICNSERRDDGEGRCIYIVSEGGVGEGTTPANAVYKALGYTDEQIAQANNVLLSSITRTETAEARVAELEGALEAAIDTLTALRWCPPGSYCTTVSGSRIGMRPECRVCIRDYLTTKGKEAKKGVTTQVPSQE